MGANAKDASGLKALEKFVLEEIAGKHHAVHAYDRLMWTVRTGFLTLFSAGWGLLLKAMFERPAATALDNRILLVMLIVSCVLGLGAFAVNLHYARRKFRVIYSLDRLMEGIVQSRGHIGKGLEQVAKHLQISGDKSNKDYKEVSGYDTEARVGGGIFLIPIAIAGVAVLLLWKPPLF